MSKKLINKLSDNKNISSTDLIDYSVDAMLTDEKTRTIWINGMPFGNTYLNTDENGISNDQPISAEVFNDFENNKATGNYSHAEGLGTKTTNEAEHASGKYNNSAEGQTIFSVGIGESDENRLNALEIMQNGAVYIGDDGNGKNPCNYPSENPVSLQSIIVGANNSLQDITHGELIGLARGGNLMPGKFYRIVDYITTTTQENTVSAGYQFDIVVLATSTNTLSEDAWVVVSERDTSGYFSNSNLGGWKIWYCLENDKNRFAWADEQNGKGVIYRMIDEFGNDCPYDFKNIKFSDNFNGWNYTFNGSSYHPSGHYPNVPFDNEDWSLFGNVKNNIVYCENHKIPKISFHSNVTYHPTSANINYCCNNTIINSDEIYIRGGNNAVMHSHNISITGSNCNIPTGSHDLNCEGSNLIYLNEVATASPKSDAGLLNNIRTIDDQIMVIPSMEYDAELEKEFPEDFPLGLITDGNARNFSIEEHVRRIGYKNTPNFCISIPEYVHTVIINGPLKWGNTVAYIELPTCSTGHKINIIERSLDNTSNYKIITQLRRQYNDGNPYEGDIIINGETKTQGTIGKYIASANTPITDGKGDIFSEMTSGSYTFQSVTLGTATCKQLIYTGDLSSYTDEGVWMCI